MKTAAAIVTNRGGRTCHAAIVARELGIPAVVGADTRHRSADRRGSMVTVSCAEGDVGKVYEGRVPFQVQTHRSRRDRAARDPHHGQPRQPRARLPDQLHPRTTASGLARLEFIINEHIKAHPMALLASRPRRGRGGARSRSRAMITDLSDGAAFFVERLSEGVGTIAAAFWPQPGDRAPVRLQDQRVCRAARRARLRAARGEPDARVPRRRALRPSGLPRGVRAWNARRCAGCARTWGSPTSS